MIFTWEGQGYAQCPPPWQAKVQRWRRCWWRWRVSWWWWWSWWCWWWCMLVVGAEYGGVTLHSSSPWWCCWCWSLVHCSGAQSGADGVTLHSLHKLVQASVFQLLHKYNLHLNMGHNHHSDDHHQDWTNLLRDCKISMEPSWWGLSSGDKKNFCNHLGEGSLLTTINYWMSYRFWLRWPRIIFLSVILCRCFVRE